MGDRANIYLEVPTGDWRRPVPMGIYLYTHYRGSSWPESLREALEFGRSRWDDDSYLARIITSRVFMDLHDDVLGGGISLVRTDNEHLIVVADLINQTVSFAEPGAEADPTKRFGHLTFAEYVAQSVVRYPRGHGYGEDDEIEDDEQAEDTVVRAWIEVVGPIAEIES